MSSETNIGQLLNQGKSLMQAGNVAEAEVHYNQALQIKADNAETLFLLANLYRTTKRKNKAVHLYEKALKISPNMLSSLINLAVTFGELERFNQALMTCNQALKIDPTNANALNVKARSYIKTLKYKDALDALDASVAFNPDHALTHNNRGIALRELGLLSDAKSAFAEAVRLAPNSTKNLINYSNILNEMALTDEAMETYKKVIRLQPDTATFQYNYYNLIESSNKIDKLREELPAVLAKFPDNTGLNLLAAKLDRRDKKFQKAIDHLRPFSNLPGTQDNLEGAIQFELGRNYDKLKDIDSAYQAFNNGKEISAKLANFATESRTDYFGQIQKNLEHAKSFDFTKWDRKYTPSQHAPFFLTGFARSGTTLLGQFLDGHPELKTSEEKPMLGNVTTHMEVNGFKFPNQLDDLTDNELKTLRQRYFNHGEDYGEKANGRILVDKNPMLTTQLAFIQCLFPDSKVIFVERHPFDVVLSCYMQFFSPKNRIGNMFTLEQIATCYDKVMTLGFAYRDTLPLKIKTFKYEDVVDDHESAAREIISFLDLPWHDGVLDYKRTALSKKRISTPSYHQVTENIYTDAKFRWVRYADKLEAVRPILEPHALKMGYSV